MSNLYHFDDFKNFVKPIGTVLGGSNSLFLCSTSY